MGKTNISKAAGLVKDNLVSKAFLVFPGYIAAYFRFTKNEELLAAFVARTSRRSVPNPHVKTRSYLREDAAKSVQARMIVSFNNVNISFLIF